jgi:hypothetical protein
MVVLMCCHGDQIVEDYVSEMANKIPDIFFYKRATVVKTTHIILLALLIILIDSDSTLRNDPAALELYSAVKRSILTILKIVKWCKDDIKVNSSVTSERAVQTPVQTTTCRWHRVPVPGTAR